jgi:thiosulfate dehydrogenase
MRICSIRCLAGTAGTLCVLLVFVFLGCTQQSEPSRAAAVDQPAAPASTEKPAAAPPAAEKPAAETVTIGACDGGSAVEVPKSLTGQALADNLLDQWKRAHPQAHWVKEEMERHALKPPADNSALLKGGQRESQTYGDYSERDLITWARETEKFVAEGSRIFHDADELGSTVAVSCDMCHPHASNTHPETYPKFQTQLGRVALLRDMIEWCIENPVRGDHLEPDSPKMRALEAYIFSQRQGVPLNYGKN